MKILVLSDLHLEFAPFATKTVDVDVVVLAGDIHLGIAGVEWAKRTFVDQQVVYVAGNHEFYKHHWVKLPTELRQAAAGSNVHFLENGAVVIDGVRFLGCTLWTDFELYGADRRHGAMLEAEEVMRDYKKIRAPRVKPGFRDDYSKLKPIQTIDRFRRSRAFLEEELRSPFEGPTVVVTHHLPTAESLPARYTTTLTSAAYASDLTALLVSLAPDVWIHGHTHESINALIGATKMVCNPRGYPVTGGAFQNELFDSSLVIDL